MTNKTASRSVGFVGLMTLLALLATPRVMAGNDAKC
jgi:hypothetical protein